MSQYGKTAPPDPNLIIFEQLLQKYPYLTTVMFGGIAFFSLSGIATIWTKYKDDRFLNKALWSLILLFPFLGWVFWMGFYPLEKTGVRMGSPEEPK